MKISRWKARRGTPASGALLEAMTASRATEHYNTGFSEGDVLTIAVDDARADVLNPATVGANSHAHAADAIAEADDAAAEAIAHLARDEVLAVAERLDRAGPEVEAAEQEAESAIAVWTSAEKNQAVQRRRMAALRLPIPGRNATIIHWIMLIVLMTGDFALLTMGYQLFGLSDRPWIPGLGFTDELHLAALSSIAFLIFLGEMVGLLLRRFRHPLEVRRTTPEAERADLPRPAAADAMLLVVFLAAALGGLWALSTIRAEYLAELGVDPNEWPFYWIQVAILTAAISLAFSHANPEAEMYRSFETARVDAERGKAAAIEAHGATVSCFNAAVDGLDTVVAKAGFTVVANQANSRLQIALYKMWYERSQPEPAQDQLFGEGSHRNPTVFDADALLAHVTGVRPLPEFAKVSTARVSRAHAAAIEELSTLQARIDQIEIAKLDLPELEPEPSATVESKPKVDDESELKVDDAAEEGPTTLPSAPAHLHSVPDSSGADVPEAASDAASDASDTGERA